MIINLSKEAENSIHAAMQSGRFASVEDAISEAIRLLLHEMNQETPATSPVGANDSAPDPIWGLMRNDAELMDEIVADAYRQRQIEPWRDVDL